MTASPSVLLALLGGLLATACAAAEVRVAVASNFTAPMTRIAADFAVATGHRAVVSAGSTGRFQAQIAAGAPYDVLLAADDLAPRRLVAEGLAVEGTRFTYALGRLVLWSSDAGVVDDAGAVLGTGRFRHLAIADPKVAPYGRAALQVLRGLGLDQTLAPRLVTGENVAQAFQFVATGHATLGFVALAQVAEPGRPAGGSMWLVPETLHEPIRQDAVLLQPGRDNAAARALLDYLRRDAARATIRAYGYRTVP